VKHPGFDKSHFNFSRGANSPQRLTRLTGFACDPIPVADTEDWGVRHNVVYRHLSGLQSGETARSESGMPGSPPTSDSS
jgi:hypothetical protein